MTRSKATAGSFVPQYLASWLRGPADPRPVYVTLFVTARCDARCPHCFYIPRIENSKAIDDLSVEEIERIARSMPPFYKLLLSGGEPFLRPDLPQVCGAFAEHCDVRQITIPTNALHPARIERQVREMVDDTRVLWEMALSIDGVGELHDEIRRVPEAFGRLSDTFERLRTLAAEVDNLVVRFNITVSQRNQDHLLEILDHIENVWRHDLVDMTIIRGEAHDPDWKRVDAEKYREAARRLYAGKKVAGGPFRRALARRTLLEKSIIAARTEGQIVPLACLAGSRTAIITEDGEVRPCEMLDVTFGNLRDADYDFATVWNSASAVQFRRFLANSSCACTFETALTTNLVYSPTAMASVLTGSSFRTLKSTRI